jgi:hypothetical protein
MCRDGLMMFVESFVSEKNINLIYRKVFYEHSFVNWKLSPGGDVLFFDLIR